MPKQPSGTYTVTRTMRGEYTHQELLDRFTQEWADYTGGDSTEVEVPWDSFMSVENDASGGDVLWTVTFVYRWVRSD